MNRKMFENRFRALQLHQTELDRKWRVYREEEEQRQILEAAGQKNVYAHTATGGVGFNKNWETVVNTAYLY